ncbi:glycoside hydrolase family 32 protein [Anditalea andensis]|uniref:Glycosyl hydrolase family 32 n=1 Tax=Anditalea andensis TaxID=1048983 RepID=A0A074KZP2_9BACT|nr:glycoside hydrolase family 32 protein [Anditalea andensis]KEO75466.1 hypothetical protein EL17_01025 [Anditalea andensis]
MDYKSFKTCCLLIVLFFYTDFVVGQYSEKYRPQFHFSPQKGWIGDPDGLVFSQGIYHLFWWGHAISEDMVYWEELAHPMKGDDNSFSYFSGSVVVDKKNTAGFGDNSMVAIYTRHYPGDSLPEAQAISVSNDGVSFQYYDKNPVLETGEIFFRDPQVFWYPPQQKWVMVVSLPDKQVIELYESKNLKEWVYMSDFGPFGAQSEFWECPDLFQLSIDGDSANKKWVMLIGQGPNRVQYFLGNFDGEKFTLDTNTEEHLLKGTGLNGKLFEGFDGLDFGEWEVQGDAFGNSPTAINTSNSLGNSHAKSNNTNYKEGKLISPEFTIEHNAINFLIAGTDLSGQTGINLIIDNEIVKSTSGDNDDVFRWKGWDVHHFKGKNALIEIVHSGSSEKDFIAIDHIMFSDVLKNHRLEHALWLDFGPDFYAGRTWRDIDETSDRITILGWMGNWDYANLVPSDWGKGFQSIPRDMALKTFEDGIRIIQNPIPELQKLRKKYQQLSNLNIEGTTSIESFSPLKNMYELDITWDTSLNDSIFGLNLLVGEGRKLGVSYNPVTQNLNIDRTNCTDYVSNSEFNEVFPTTMSAIVAPVDNMLRLHILVDQSSVEIFTNHGEIVFSLLTFPNELQTGIEFFSNHGISRIADFKAWELASIWENKNKNINKNK